MDTENNSDLAAPDGRSQWVGRSRVRLDGEPWRPGTGIARQCSPAAKCGVCIDASYGYYSLAEIGLMHGVTRQRVDQVLAKHGTPMGEVRGSRYKPARLAPHPVEAFWAQAECSSDGEGCWEWIGVIDPAGYGRVLGAYAHRRSYELTYESIPAGLYVCHHCDNPKCVRPDHLYAGTARDNARDREDRGRRPTDCVPRGEKHHKAKLTADVIPAIFERFTRGESRAALAREYGVRESVIYAIGQRRAWKHVEVTR